MVNGLLVGYSSNMDVLDDLERDLIIMSFREAQLAGYIENPTSRSITDFFSWYVEGGHIVGLHVRNLSVLPGFLFELPKLEELIVFSNSIQRIPSFANLKRMVLVNLKPGTRQIECMAQPKLENLQLIGFSPTNQDIFENISSLSLRRINFDELSPIISQLNLKRIELSNIDGDITCLLDMTSLEQLEIFIARPEIDLTKIDNLKNLKSLVLFDINLREIPKNIGNLSKLEYLDLGKNSLTTLPEEMGELTALKILKVRSNKLSKLPSSLGNIKDILEIDFRDNKINALPSFFKSLPSLFKLQVENIALESLRHLKNASLEYLSIVNCKGDSLPECIFEQFKLKTLIIWKTPITNIPGSIGNLKSLKWLFLRSLKIESLPKEMFELTKLEKLNIEDCPVKFIPNNIGGLKSLKSISIFSNVLTYFPIGLSSLQNLKRVELQIPNSPIPNDYKEILENVEVAIIRSRNQSIML